MCNLTVMCLLLILNKIIDISYLQCFRYTYHSEINLIFNEKNTLQFAVELKQHKNTIRKNFQKHFQNYH